MYAVLIVWGLQRGTAAFWAVVLPAVIVGDLLHLATFLHGMTAPTASWGVAAIANVFYVCIYVPLKVLVALRPDRIARAARGARRGA